MDPPRNRGQHDGLNPLVVIRDLRVAFDCVPVLHGIDLAVARGESLGLVGESGCGKSVTWLAALGLLPRSAGISGSVTLDGEELLGAPASAMDQVRGGRIALILQDPMSTLNPVHRVGRQVEEAVRLHRGMDGAAARAEALRLLDQVGIPDARRRYHMYPHEMSGGQNQRMMIAMALAGQPGTARRRRADHGARRDHPGRHPRPAAPLAGGDRDGAGADQPRSRRGGGDVQPGLRDVCRPHRRGVRAPTSCSPARCTRTPPACWPRCRTCTPSAA